MCLALGPWTSLGEQRAFEWAIPGQGLGLPLPIQLLPCTQETQLYLGVKQTKSNFLG